MATKSGWDDNDDGDFPLVWQVELNWSQAVDVFEFFCPLSQPTFNSTKLGITAELLNLFRRVVTLLPKSLQPGGCCFGWCCDWEMERACVCVR